MSTTPEGVRVFQESGVLFARGMRPTPGAWPTSGMEMTQTVEDVLEPRGSG
jgi:hypothetical protein